MSGGAPAAPPGAAETGRFDTVIVVDWSGGNDRGPRPKADAIWAGMVRDGAPAEPLYLRHRQAAEAWLADTVAAERAAGRRVLAAFDFPFGFPAGFAAALTGTADPLALWDWFEREVEDTPDRNNRFDLAGRINARFPGVGPFWGNGLARDVPHLPRRGRARTGHGLPERRAAEHRAPRAFPCWQLSGAGAVGSQAILGLPVLARLRRRFAAAAWPFEPTGGAGVALIEVWPSLIAEAVRAATRPGDIRDAVQVRLLAGALARLSPGRLAAMLDVEAPEEGWILGLGHEAELDAVARALPRDAAPASGPAAAPPLAGHGADPAAIAASSGPAPGAPASTAADPVAREAAIADGGAGPMAPTDPPAADGPAAGTACREPGAPKAAAAAPSTEPRRRGAPRPAAPGGRLADDCFALPPGVDWTPVDTALERLRAAMRPVTAVETLPVAAAAGRILAEPAAARRANPPAANAAVDGYAFAFDSAGVEADLALADGRAAAGAPFAGPVPPGSAVRILTGAELPAGADTVVMDEDCRPSGARLTFPRPRKRGANVRPAGEDCQAGATLFSPGRRLRPADLARLSAGGVAEVTVRRPLRVAVLSTGDELLAPGADPATPGIFDANRPMLAALAAEQGFAVTDLGAAPDRAESVRAALDRGAAEADAILTSGGASAGDEDHVSRLLGAEGRLAIWRIAVKPGRPLALGSWRGTPVFGLPGNPVAAFVCFLVFARPALGVMAGGDWHRPQGYPLPAAFAKSKKRGRREFLRARPTGDGRVEVFHSEGSGLIGGLSWAEGLVELPDEGMEIAPGDPVRYLPFASFLP